MHRALGILLVFVTACTGAVADTSTTPATLGTTTLPTTTTITATTTTTPPVECPAAPYELTELPFGVGEGSVSAAETEPDVWTSVAGSHTSFISRADDTLAIALIRGTLPAVDWPGKKGEVDIDGTRAAVGPHPDGTWVAGWYEAPGERCDLYTMVFYSPWSPGDVQMVLGGMNRVGG